MAFRQYRRASSGVDAAVQQILYVLAIATAPVWIPIVLVVGTYQYCASNSPGAKAERAKVEAKMQADEAARVQRLIVEQKHAQEIREAEAHAPWDALRCEALYVRLDRAVRGARRGSDYDAVLVPKMRQEALDHSCKR